MQTGNKQKKHHKAKGGPNWAEKRDKKRQQKQ